MSSESLFHPSRRRKSAGDVVLRAKFTKSQELIPGILRKMIRKSAPASSLPTAFSCQEEGDAYRGLKEEMSTAKHNHNFISMKKSQDYKKTATRHQEVLRAPSAHVGKGWGQV